MQVKHLQLIFRSQHFFFCIQDDGASEDKNRPSSDPGPRHVQSNSPQGVFQRLVSTTNKTALDLLSLEK